MSTHWWRAYDEAVDDPKLILLSDRAHRAWFNLMCVASATNGALPTMAVLEVKLRIPRKKLDAILVELRDAKLFDEVEGVLRPHNWNARQFKSDVSTERVQRFRKQKRNVSETPPETDTEAETEKKKDAADAAPPDFERDYFRRGKQILGPAAGGMLAKLLQVKNKNIHIARAILEVAATKQNPREYIGAIIVGGNASVEGRRLTNDELHYRDRLPGTM